MLTIIKIILKVLRHSRNNGSDRLSMGRAFHSGNKSYRNSKEREKLAREEQNLEKVLEDFENNMPEFNARTGCLPILFLMGAFFGLFFGGAMFFLSTSQKNFLEVAIKTTAIVQRISSNTSCSTSSSRTYRDGNTGISRVRRDQTKNCEEKFFAEYKFKDKTGKELTERSIISEEDYSFLKKGQEIVIFYNKNDPSDSRTEYEVKGYNSPIMANVSKISLLIGGLCVLFLVIPVRSSKKKTSSRIR